MTTKKLTNLDTDIQPLIDRGALFVINHSGGKDSQAMTTELRAIVPISQILVIHAHLPEVEWHGTWEHIVENTFALEVKKVQAGKTFFEMVERRQMWPGAQHRQCTSDLKRGPIEKEIRAHIKERGLSGLVVNCMGIRAEESPRRAKAVPFKFNSRNSKAGREWYDWLPIFKHKIEDVWAIIESAGQKPHWAYAEGMSRLSCCFCILASSSDLKIAARLHPELYKRYVDTERRINFTMRNGVTLEEVTGI